VTDEHIVGRRGHRGLVRCGGLEVVLLGLLVTTAAVRARHRPIPVALVLVERGEPDRSGVGRCMPARTQFRGSSCAFWYRSGAVRSGSGWRRLRATPIRASRRSCVASPRRAAKPEIVEVDRYTRIYRRAARPWPRTNISGTQSLAPAKAGHIGAVMMQREPSAVTNGQIRRLRVTLH
jgi:hypothetical protein